MPTVSIDAILEMGNETAKEFWKKWCGIQGAMVSRFCLWGSVHAGVLGWRGSYCPQGNSLKSHFLQAVKGETDALKKELSETAAGQENAEQMIIDQLEKALIGIRQEERVSTICSKLELFRPGGFLYHHAKRLFKKGHFTLPLLYDIVCLQV